MDHSDPLGEKYSLSSVIIGVSLWMLGVWIASSTEPIELSLGRMSEVSISPITFFVLLVVGMIISLKSYHTEQLSTFKVLGIILNWGMLVSLILLYTTN